MPHGKKSVQTDRHSQEKLTAHFSIALMTESEINLTFDESLKILYVPQLTKFTFTRPYIMLEWAGSVTIEVRNILASEIVIQSI